MLEVNMDHLSHNVFGPDKRIVPTIQFEAWLNFKRSNPKNIKIHLTSMELSISGQSIGVSKSTIRDELVSSQVKITEEISFPKYLIQSIEQKRIDDLPISLTIEGLVSYNAENNISILDNFRVSREYKQSQKEWTGILEKMGYNETWIIEMQRPKIEGFEIVKEHLQKASEAIDRRDYEKAISDCRVAWESLNPLINSLWDKLVEEIDSGSIGEEKFPKKSERIKKLRDVVLLWSQIGVHREAYRVIPEDALLCYRTTIALVSFLSSLSVKSKTKNQE